MTELKTRTAVSEHQERLEQKFANGLKDVKYYVANRDSDVTYEDLCSSINAFDQAIEQQRYHVLDFSQESQNNFPLRKL